MHPITAIDWHALFVPTVSLLELVLRGSVMYLFVLVAMRLFRRDAGALSMASEYHSLTEGAVLVATIFAWNYGLDWLAYRYPRVHRLLNPPPLLLIENGRLRGRNLRAEMLTKADLAEQLREQGIEDFAEVRRCYLEGDGHLSVIRRSKDEKPPPPKRRPMG